MIVLVSLRDREGDFIKDLKTLNSADLIAETQKAIEIERQSTAVVVRHFEEIYARKIYLERGYPSLFEMATHYFGFCPSAAHRRINSMKLMRELPEIETKLESGALSLTTASTLQSFFAAEAKTKSPYSNFEKLSVVQSCLNKSTREVERQLATLSPEREKRESARFTSKDRVRMSVSISDDLFAKLERLKNLWSHSNPTFSTEILLERVIDMALEKVDPVRIAERNSKQKSQPMMVALRD